MISSSHRSRLITAALAIPAVVLVTLAGGWPLFGAVLLVSALGLWEFFSIAMGRDSRPRTVILAVFGALLSVPIFSGFLDGDSVLVLGVLLGAAWVEKIGFLTRFGTSGGSEPSPEKPGLLPLGLLYVTCSLGFFLRLTPVETFFVLSAVAVSDTGAYYCGGLIGGPRIWPAVSPKKTWAGSLGGLVLCVGWCLLYGWIWGEARELTWIGLGAAMNLASQCGDFYESAFKRAAGIKDSGTILPGHGGVLDRIDGLLPATLVYAWASGAHDLFL